MIVDKFDQIENKWLEDIPVIIPTFNQLTYTKYTLSRLQDFGIKNFIILDNGSTYKPFVEWINVVEYPVIIDHTNFGPHKFFLDSTIWNNLPDLFIATDPDLEYPSSIPDSLIQDLIDVSEEHELSKLALGLDMQPENKMYKDVKIWENNYWKNIFAYTKYGDPIYNANTDTTFALYNKKYFKKIGELSWESRGFFDAPRLCGKYLVKHLGWYIEKNIPKEEFEFYQQNSSSRFANTVHATK